MGLRLALSFPVFNFNEVLSLLASSYVNFPYLLPALWRFEVSRKQ